MEDPSFKTKNIIYKMHHVVSFKLKTKKIGLKL